MLNSRTYESAMFVAAHRDSPVSNIHTHTHNQIGWPCACVLLYPCISLNHCLTQFPCASFSCVHAICLRPAASSGVHLLPAPPAVPFSCLHAFYPAMDACICFACVPVQARAECAGGRAVPVLLEVDCIVYFLTEACAATAAILAAISSAFPR